MAVARGIEPTIFEQGPVIGGQWTGLPDTSGVWPAMHTNTSRILTAFSDLEHDGDQTFLSNRDVLAYLHRYAGMFGLDARIRLGAKVTLLRQDGSRWVVEHHDGVDVFDWVAVASGRFQTPVVPEVPDLETFAGSEGAIPTYRYRNADRFRGKRVLVAGCAVSALEIASELASPGRPAARRGLPQKTRMNLAAVTFARPAGCRAAAGGPPGAPTMP